VTYFDSAIGSGRLALLIVTLLVAFGFEFVNGFHDTANAVATVIYTRTLRPWHAVIWSGLCNFLGVYLGGIAVAMSIIKLLPVELLASSGSGAGLAMVLALLVAAILWNLGTWYFGLPASSSHTLIGAIVGVGLASSLAPGRVFGTGVNWHKVQEIGISLVVSPIFGMALAALLLLGARRLLASRLLHEPADPDRTPPWWVRLLLVGTCSGVSFAHGSNDGQKGVGLVMLILIGILPADYALNTRYDAAQIDSAIAVADHIEKTTRIAYSDAEPPVLAANAPVPVPDEPAAKVVLDLAALRAKLAGKKTLREVPTDERWDLRAQVLRIDANLSLLEKTQPKALSKEQGAVMKADRLALRGLVDYAPSWVLVLVALALGIGTMIGWKRIVVTVGEKIGKTHMSYAQGAAAELVAASTIGVSASLGLPVSTTHVLSSGIAGTMLAQRSGLQKSTVRNIALAWILTLPASMVLAAVLFMAFRSLIPDAAAATAVRRVDTSLSASDRDATPIAQVDTTNALRLHGSNTVGAALAPDLVEAFFLSKGGRRVQRNAATGAKPGWTISAELPGQAAPSVMTIEAAGTATAFADLAAGACDIGLASRRATTEEAAKIAAAGLGDIFSSGAEHVLALDGLAVIVDKRNPTDVLTMTDLARIFSGVQASWTGDAATRGVINLYARDERSGTVDTFKSLVLGGRPMAAMRRVGDNARLVELVSTETGAIGFAPMSATGAAKVVAIGDETVAPAVPSSFNVATESYPLTRRVYLYTTAGTVAPLANELITFALSEAGQRVVAAAGFVDLSVKRRPATPCAKTCPARYATLTSAAERLSLDFRFRAGRAELDTRAKEDVGRLVAFAHDHPSERIGLLGFADDVGQETQNLAVSRERAEAVATALRDGGVVPAVVDAFGEALPVASNRSAAGREHNRRVEAWVLH
jgi:PiT family inorganic phosphate transporter